MEEQAGLQSQSTKVVAILAFHKIGDPSRGGWETWNYISETSFAKHLDCLGENDWRVVDLTWFLRGLEEPDILPQRAALLTFDDGYRSMCDVVLPWLRRFGYPAVLFIPTGFIGGHNDFDAELEPKEPICGWRELSLLERHGVSVQSHGVTHRSFSALAPAEREQELRQSKALLEQGLRKPIEVVAYPYGDDGGDARAAHQLVHRAGYRAACLYGGGLSSLPNADRYRLPRLAMGADTNLQALLDQQWIQSESLAR
jgi:peptidoglycan/xylan/chitin deacetylase (PgdA/CDA1 family)